jgi:hypothetical protein
VAPWTVDVLGENLDPEDTLVQIDLKVYYDIMIPKFTDKSG